MFVVATVLALAGAVVVSQPVNAPGVCNSALQMCVDTGLPKQELCGPRYNGEYIGGCTTLNP